MSNKYVARYPAAFINAIAEEGSKQEAIEWLQRTWDELQDLRREHELRAPGAQPCAGTGDSK